MFSHTEIEEMLEIVEIFLEDNLMCASLVISDGVILITPFEPDEEISVAFNITPVAFNHPWNFDLVKEYGWSWSGPDANGVYSLIPDPEVDNPQEME